MKEQFKLRKDHNKGSCHLFSPPGTAYKLMCNRLSEATRKVEQQKREPQPNIVLADASLTTFWYLRDWKRHTAL